LNNIEAYLDNAATTQIFKEVNKYMFEIQRDVFGNPSSRHTLGSASEKLINRSREVISKKLDVTSKEVFFTASATEANNLAILGYLKRNPRAGRHIICSEIEHPSVLNVYEMLSQNGYEVDRIKTDSSGQIDLDHLNSLVRIDTALVSVMFVNNETGAIQPIRRISEVIKEINLNVVFHVDAVQGFCKLDFSVKKLGVDLATISAHKIHGPKGIGALYVRKGVKVSPIIFGGGQEYGLRSGTENVSAIAGFGKTVELLDKEISNNISMVRELRGKFIDKLAKELVLNSFDDGSPYILNISFPGIKSEVMLHHLESEGIYISSGSACASNRNTQSHVLKSMGVAKAVSDSAIRISFSELNTHEEVMFAAEKINYFLNKLGRSK